MRITSCLIVAVLGLACCGGAAWAGTWSVSAEGGYVIHDFEPHYTFTGDRADRDFENRAHGAELRLAGVYDIELHERVTLGLSAYAGANDAEWTLKTDEPASLTYDIPYTFGICATPSISLVGGLSVFAELGIGQGLVHQEKTSPVSSHYDYEEWTTSYSLAAGLRYVLTENLSVFALYRSTTYEDFSYRTHLPDGTHHETITDEPETTTVSGGVLIRL